MAVSKIRKFSSYTFLALAAISIVIFALFFFGGYELDPKGNKVYEYTGALIVWTYFLGAVTIISTLGFAVINFFSSFARDSKAALRSVSGVLVLIAVLVITYLIGSGEPLVGLNADSQKFNTAGWLRLTDMFLYTTSVLLFAVLAVVGWGIIKALANK